jgi:ABC-type multidrug transport system ATPase subunit
LTDVERFCDRYAIIVGGKLQRVELIADLLESGKGLEDVFLADVENAAKGGAV